MTQPDDLEAVRTIVATLQPFEDSDRERVLRWVKEKLGMKDATPIPAAGQLPTMSPVAAVPAVPPVQSQGSKTDIKTFVSGKNPANDNEFVATVAYYYQFEAPEAEKKDSIGKDEIVDACRKVPWKQPSRPPQTLINAEAAGYVDKVSAGRYRINSVGENLVIMVLSGKSERPKIKSQRAKKNARHS